MPAMNRTGSHRKPHSGMLRALACLALCLMALRALIPAGYMPDARALEQGRLELAFCSVNGPATISLDVHGDSSPDPHSAPSAADCPFGAASSPANGLIPPPLAALPVAVRVADASLPAGGVAVAASLTRGPPLGSRAPPFFLA